MERLSHILKCQSDSVVCLYCVLAFKLAEAVCSDRVKELCRTRWLAKETSERLHIVETPSEWESDEQQRVVHRKWWLTDISGWRAQLASLFGLFVSLKLAASRWHSVSAGAHSHSHSLCSWLWSVNRIGSDACLKPFILPFWDSVIHQGSKVEIMQSWHQQI